MVIYSLVMTLQAVRRAQAQLSEVLQTLPEEDRQVEFLGTAGGKPEKWGKVG